MEEIRKRWEIAQVEERKAHANNYEDGIQHYEGAYTQYFGHLQCGFYLRGKTIMEIGCADFAALGYCSGLGAGHIIEPLPSWMLKKQIEGKPITIYKKPAEEMEVIPVDEVWLFNVYQHVLDPYKIFEYAKKCGKVVRFFEPIDLPLDVCHLHSLSLEDFRGVFGDCVKLYKSKPDVKNFHAADCAYGVWKNPESL